MVKFNYNMPMIKVEALNVSNVIGDASLFDTLATFKDYPFRISSNTVDLMYYVSGSVYPTAMYLYSMGTISTGVVALQITKDVANNATILKKR